MAVCHTRRAVENTCDPLQTIQSQHGRIVWSVTSAYCRCFPSFVFNRQVAEYDAWVGGRS